MDSDDLVTIADVFPGGAWQKAARCGPNGGNCVEVNLGSQGLAGIRDSKFATGSVLVFDHGEWGAFRDAAASGRFVRG